MLLRGTPPANVIPFQKYVGLFSKVIRKGPSKKSRGYLRKRIDFSYFLQLLFDFPLFRLARRLLDRFRGIFVFCHAFVHSIIVEQYYVHSILPTNEKFKDLSANPRQIRYKMIIAPFTRISCKLPPCVDSYSQDIYSSVLK